EKAIEALVKRHEILRTTFITRNGEPKQKIHDYESLDFSVNYTRLGKDENLENARKELIKEEDTTPFNLEKGPLLRTRLLHIEEDRYLFLFTMHHIVSDGWSKDVVIEEFITLYNAYSNGKANPMPALPIQYKDYTQWHNNQLSGDNLEKHRGYWMNLFSGKIPLLQLPTDYPRPDLRTFAGGYIFFPLSKEISEHLKRISRESGGTLFMIFLALINVFFYRNTGQTDI
ncbi:MAG: non-ribosomal peptide synthetase, partial [bacterium]|nr:non-ribosomal peptide synthetase [bacterium]